MSTDFTLAAYGVQKGSTIYVILRLRGGSEQIYRHLSEGCAVAGHMLLSTSPTLAETVNEIDDLEDLYAG